MPAILEPMSNSNQTVPLDKPIIFIGRHPDCDLIINHSRKVSRKHCCLIEIERKFFVRDLGSTNGIQINGQRVKGLEELTIGDELTVGDCAFTFKPEEAVQPPQIKADSTNQPIVPIKIDAEDVPLPVSDSLLSSEIPILLDEPEDDGFDVGAGDYISPRKNKKRMGSDSQAELIAE